jgi:nucleotide-binding universal stress UspA family protein
MFTKILVPLDGSPLGERALPIALLIAQAMNARLALVRAVWTRGMVPRLDTGSTYQVAMQEAEAYLEMVARRIGPGVQVEAAVTHAPSSQGVLRMADEMGADLIVMTTHGRSGVSRWVYGSVAEAILARSHIPVLLVRTQTPTPPRPNREERPKLLVPLDGSKFAETALPSAANLARALDWTVVLLRVVVPPVLSVDDPELQRPFRVERLTQQARHEAEQYLQAVAQPLRCEGVRVMPVLRSGKAAGEILDESAAVGASLVVMATHGRTGVGRLWYGSVAEKVLHEGALPLLLVRPEVLQAANHHHMMTAVE